MKTADDRNIMELGERGPEVVTLCGSTRFRAEFDAADAQLTLAGFIVLRPGVWGHDSANVMDAATKAELDRLHLEKIDMSNRVVVICPNRYIGESTLREIIYATARAKVIEYRDATSRTPGGIPRSGIASLAQVGDAATEHARRTAEGLR